MVALLQPYLILGSAGSGVHLLSAAPSVLDNRRSLLERTFREISSHDTTSVAVGVAIYLHQKTKRRPHWNIDDEACEKNLKVHALSLYLFEIDQESEVKGYFGKAFFIVPDDENRGSPWAKRDDGSLRFVAYYIPDWSYYVDGQRDFLYCSSHFARRRAPAS